VQFALEESVLSMMKRRDRSDPDWNAAADEELARWKAKSYRTLRAEIDDEVVAYERQGPGGPYQVEVQLLGSTPEQVHVLISVCAPHGFVCRSLDRTFIRDADEPGARHRRTTVA